MKTDKLVFYIIVLVIFVVAVGCQSLPEPASPNDTLVVVDINRQTEEGASIFGYLNLTIAPVADPSVTTDLSLNAGETYETVQGLAPGTYRAVALRWEYQEDSKVIDYDPPTDTFTVESGAISVYPYAFLYTVKDGRMSFRWDSINEREKKSFLQSELAEEDAFSLWNTTG